MDTVRLTVFRVVATLGSFTSAAKSLRYTQSAVSRQIAALEDDLAVALFDREARGVRLTEEGRVLLAHAEAVLDRLDVARRELAALRAVDGGRLRIGAFATAEAALVPRAMAAFQRDFPNVELSLSDGLTAALAARLRAGELDVAVVNHGPALDGLTTHHVLDDPQFVALPPDHRLARRKSVRLTELAEENWIAGSTTVEDTLIGACLRSGFRPEVRYVVQEWTAKQGLVAAGLGVTLVPGLLMGAVRPDIVLTRLRSPDMTPRKVVAAVTDRAAVQRFLPYLTASARALLTACRAAG
ncbi:LysR family transcriptional regulator [Actinophytocola sp. NPDC049390]|uniref:LysR family transcriptional regulator n=1 Tax=Actinophytocola sp. NPDC049390 TaxID=3363894 RepID=UPI00378C9517